MTRVVDLDDTPRVLASADCATLELDGLVTSDNSEWHEATELGVLLDSVLVVLLDVVREVVNGNAVVLNVLHDELLALGQLHGSERVGLADDGDDVDAR